jgi:hypothetical protein
VKLAGLVFSGAGLSMELSPLPYPANITENKPVNDVIKINLALLMTLLPFYEGVSMINTASGVAGCGASRSRHREHSRKNACDHQMTKSHDLLLGVV